MYYILFPISDIQWSDGKTARNNTEFAGKLVHPSGDFALAVNAILLMQRCIFLRVNGDTHELEMLCCDIMQPVLCERNETEAEPLTLCTNDPSMC